jgi:hypothetical protein
MPRHGVWLERRRRRHDTPPDASVDVATDIPSMMDVSAETGGGGGGGGGADARSDAVDAPSAADTRDVADAGGDRVVLDVPSGSDADATIDALPPDMWSMS